MKTDVSQIGGVQMVEREWSLPAFARRIFATGRRFPLASQGLMSIIDQAVVSATSFITAAVIGRLTSPDTLGFYYLVLSIVLIISGIHEQVIAAPYWVYSKRHAGDDLAHYAGSFWVHHFVLTGLISGCLLAAILVTEVIGSSELSRALWALLGAGPFLLLRDGIRRFSLANLHVKTAIVLDTIVALAQICGLLILGFTGQISLASIYGVMASACLLASSAWYLFDQPRVQFRRERFMPDWRYNWAFGRWALRSFLVGNTTPFLLLWILALTAGPAATGLMGACSTIAGLTNVILLGVGNVLTAQAARAFITGGSSDLRRLLQRTAAFFVIVMGGFCLLVLATGDRFVVYTFGAHYYGTGAILLTLCLTALVNSLGLVVGNGLFAIDNPRSNFIADVVCLMVTLSVAAILIRPFGALGAALASLSGASTAVIVRTLTLWRQLDRAFVPSVFTNSVFRRNEGISEYEQGHV